MLEKQKRSTLIIWGTAILFALVATFTIIQLLKLYTTIQ